MTLGIDQYYEVARRLDVAGLDAAACSCRDMRDAVRMVWVDQAKRLRIDLEGVNDCGEVRKRVLARLRVKPALWLPTGTGGARFPMVTYVPNPTLASGATQGLVVEWRIGKLLCTLPSARIATYLRRNYVRSGDLPAKWTFWNRHVPEALDTLFVLLALGMAIATVGGLRRRYQLNLARHRHALATVDPEVIAKWQAAYGYETSLRRLQSQFVGLNTEYVSHTYMINGHIHVRYVPVRCNRISPAEFWQRLQADLTQWDALQEVWMRAGQSAEKAYDQLFLSQIPLAGPSPIPDAPSRALHVLGALTCGTPFVMFATAAAHHALHPPEETDMKRFERAIS